MSESFGCKCEERRKPLAERAWVVLDYKCNHSAFSGYHHTPSDYSCVACLKCLKQGRTKAAYVASLPMDKGDWEKALLARSETP